MNLRSLHIPTMFGALLASLLTTAAASAQEVRVQVGGPGYAQEPDWARFRGGISLEGGALLVPGVVNIGGIGLVSQLGVQINNNWGVYAIPNFDILAGKLAGLSVGAGVLFDYTFDNIPISVGGGPEVGAFVAFGGSGCSNQGDGTACTTISDAGGAFYGARLHFAYYPVIVRYRGLPRRRALSIGFDLRLLEGAFGSASSNAMTATASATANGFAASPMLSIGYTAF
jgi:hypothetical protein